MSPRAREKKQAEGPRAREAARPVKRGKAKTALSRAIPGDGSYVILYLKEPREQSWGVLLKTEQAGVWVRSIPLDSIEDWARETAAGGDGVLGPSSFFVPFLRVEKIVLDEPWGPVPSLAQRFERIAGCPAARLLQLESSREPSAENQ